MALVWSLVSTWVFPSTTLKFALYHVSNTRSRWSSLPTVVTPATSGIHSQQTHPRLSNHLSQTVTALRNGRQPTLYCPSPRISRICAGILRFDARCDTFFFSLLALILIEETHLIGFKNKSLIERRTRNPAFNFGPKRLDEPLTTDRLPVPLAKLA